MRKLEARFPEALGEKLRPRPGKPGPRIEYLGEVMPLELAHARPVDIEKAITPGLNLQQQKHQQHREQENAVMGGWR